ncbi:DUF6922 domain-containing protein [Rhodoflexus caldus]|uniref:DUF6922 domain-containing protein n=1 Tax=Rhodoflexus caldus TaxID=2891236 RepID=UPI00202AAFA6|nr:hypothetical protein [Rhodoflexus caldus]
MELSKVIFWDTEYSKLDYEKHRNYIIERVLIYGKVTDWRAIQAYYGNDIIKQVAINARNLDAKTLAFVSNLFDIPKQQFRCYTMLQSVPKHWDY